MSAGRKNVLTALLILLAFLIGGAVFLFVLSRAGISVGPFGRAPQMREFELTTDEPVSCVSASLRDCNLSLIPAADGRIRVKIRCPEDREIRAEAGNEVLKIEVPEDGRIRRLFSLDREPSSVTLSLPPELSLSLLASSTSGDLDSAVTNLFVNVNVQTASGDVAWRGDNEIGACEIRTASGDVSVSRIETNRLDIQTESGELLLLDCGCAPKCGITVGTVSGDILLRSSSAQAIAAHTTSGDMTFEAVAAEDAVILSTTSGELKLADLAVKGLCQINTVSGDVHFVRADAGKFDVETVSGDVTGSLLGIEKEVRTNGSASEENWQIGTTSGFVHIFPVSEE